MELISQKTDISSLISTLEDEIKALNNDKRILISAINSIDICNENILISDSIIAKETRQVMRKHIDKI